MRSNTSLLGKILMGIALRLEILTKILRIIFSQNLSVYSVCSVDPCTLCVPWIRKGRKRKKAPCFIAETRCFVKDGGLLLSRIALQYHRRKWA